MTISELIKQAHEEEKMEYNKSRPYRHGGKVI